MLPITMRRGRTFRWGRTRPADGQSNNSETLSRIQSLADYTIDTLESSFQKRHRFDLDCIHHYGRIARTLRAFSRVQMRDVRSLPPAEVQTVSILASGL